MMDDGIRVTSGGNNDKSKKVGFSEKDPPSSLPKRKEGKEEGTDKCDDGIRVTLGVNKNEKKIDFLQDDPSEMTYGRRIALFMMNRFKWYNPKLGSGTTATDLGFKSTEEESFDIGEGQKKHYSYGHEDKDITTPMDGQFRSKEMGHPVAVTPKDEDANLDEAWAYFEHVTLPRHIFRNKEEENKKTCVSRIVAKFASCFQTSNQQLDSADPGESKYDTKLYHPFFTPHSQLGDFGIGCGVYFTTLRAFSVLTLIAGLINIPNMMYYSSEAYGSNRDMINDIGIRSSAVCTDHEWVICTDCFVSASFPGDRVRFYNETNTTTGKFDIPQIRFARKNDCDAATIQNGMINFATLIFIALGIIVIIKRMSAFEIAFDVDEQTAQDYSILIENPPSDAYLPEEWKHFFETNFRDVHVTCCIIGVDNDLLLNDLVERREIMKKLEMMVDPGTRLEALTLAGISARVQQNRGTIANLLKIVSPGIPELFAKLAALNARIKGLAQLTYPVTNVFITFETEKAQRAVLKSLTVGKFQAWCNDSKAIQNDSYLFRDEHVLYVSEPDEPSTIRWEHLNANILSKFKNEAFTAIATFIAIASVASVTWLVDYTHPHWSVYIISVTNVLFPIVGKILVSMEEHPSEGDKQASLYWKIAFFRWANTALVFTIITPFNLTVDYTDGVILDVHDLFFAEMTISTVLQLLDIGGHFSRHFSAPRGKTQDAMDLSMSGGTFDLAERYTNMSKFLFLALWYSSIYPAGFFMCSLGMFINYYVDRFSLTRSWKKPMHLGNEISTLNKKIFFPLCVFAMALASSYFWSGFPYDNLCLKGTIGERNDYTSEYLTLGEYNNGTITNIPPHNYENVESPEPNITLHINSDTEVYEHCFQDFLRTRGRTNFPFVPSNQKAGNVWMTPEQELVTNIYGWTTFGIMILLILIFLYQIHKNIRSFFVGAYEDRGEDQGINFSNVESISTYIPQVSSTVYPYPLLACSVDDIDTDLLEWHDDDRPHAFYDITLDAKVLTARLDDHDETDENSTTTTRKGKIVFCEVAHWPPQTEAKKKKKGSKNDEKRNV